MSQSPSDQPQTGPQRPVLTGPSGPIFYTGLLAAVVGSGLFLDHTAARTAASPAAVAAVQADLARESASANVRQLAQWAVDSGDHAGLPFVVVDKERARLFAFDGTGQLRASAPVLLGAVRSDAPEAPATPAGRFVADTWQSTVTGSVVFVDGDVALSLHALPSPASPGRAAQRLASDRVEDKRISDGSLHVASDFYRDYIAPLQGRTSIAYVLPEVLPLHGTFSSPRRDTVLRIAQWPRPAQSRRPS